MEKLTAIIPTFNEEHNIVEAIKSVDFADEIIVVDSFSTDKTVELATPLATKVIKREYINSASQKNWAIPQAQHSWILLLDADERVTPELKLEVVDKLKENPAESGFWIYRINHFMGKRINFSGWRGDKVIRLFKRDECKYEALHVHAEIISDGKIGFLNHKLHHNTYVSTEVFEKKMVRYAKWQAKDYDGKTGVITPYHTLIKPLARFFKHFVIQFGFLDGYVGFIIAHSQACAVSKRYKFLRELRANREN
ncbi:MAG: glycosyl transferase family 2 [Crocinitomicaceae bacterium]|nr:glycosyl transferase family 2 [Crocinitomicaceae bacterium]|tara:strand:+ start:994 stop:1749 length:756 start_codon:yes stop_codon:yes gene_type:complete